MRVESNRESQEKFEDMQVMQNSGRKAPNVEYDSDNWFEKFYDSSTQQLVDNKNLSHKENNDASNKDNKDSLHQFKDDKENEICADKHIIIENMDSKKNHYSALVNEYLPNNNTFTPEMFNELHLLFNEKDNLQRLFEFKDTEIKSLLKAVQSVSDERKNLFKGLTQNNHEIGKIFKFN